MTKIFTNTEYCGLSTITLQQKTLKRSLSKMIFPDISGKMAHLKPFANGKNLRQQILNTFGIFIDISERDLKKIPAKGPCILIANYPFGGIEDILISSILQEIRHDFKILNGNLIEHIAGLRNPYSFVQLFCLNTALKNKLLHLRKSWPLLQDKGMLVIFPSNTVSGLKTRYGTESNWPWHKNIIKLYKQGVPVLPVYLKGNSRPLLQSIAMIHPLLEKIFHAGQLKAICNNTWTVRINAPILPQELKTFASESDKLIHLRDSIFELEDKDDPQGSGKTSIRFVPVTKAKILYQLGNNGKYRSVSEQYH